MSSFKSKIEKSYSTWEKRNEKIGVKASNYGEYFNKVAKLKDDLCDFADRFDRTFSKPKNSVEEIAQNLYEDIRNSFVGKIASAEEFSKYYANDVENAEVKKKLNELNQYYSKIKKTFDSRGSLSDFFDSTVSKLEVQSFDYAEVKISKFLLIFFSEIISAMRSKLLVAEKIMVKDKDYFTKVKKGLWTKIYRFLFPKLYEEGVKKSESLGRHVVEPTKKNLKIFPKGKPLVSEVKQVNIGDCYLVATLISLAKTNPRAIEKCFVQGLDKIEKLDKIDIRLFRGKNIFSPVPVIITISRKRVIDPRAIKGGALWPKLIEKAYAVYRSKGYDMQKPVLKMLDGGKGWAVMFAITGKAPKYKFQNIEKMADMAPWVKRDPFNILSKVKKELKKSKSLTCGFKEEFKIKDVKKGDIITIFKGHAYAIVGIDENKKYVRLINPWKEGGRKVKNSPKSKEGGHIAISFDDFENNVLDVDYTGRKLKQQILEQSEGLH